VSLETSIGIPPRTLFLASLTGISWPFSVVFLREPGAFYSPLSLSLEVFEPPLENGVPPTSCCKVPQANFLSSWPPFIWRVTVSLRLFFSFCLLFQNPPGVDCSLYGQGTLFPAVLYGYRGFCMLPGPCGRDPRPFLIRGLFPPPPKNPLSLSPSHFFLDPPRPGRYRPLFSTSYPNKFSTSSLPLPPLWSRFFSAISSQRHVWSSQ